MAAEFDPAVAEADRSAPAQAAWQPVAHSEDVVAKPAPTRVGGDEFAVFRDRAGVVRAVEDRCPHRRVPLSLGWVTESGSIQCGYHGWSFDGGSGQCVAIPNYRPGEKIPPSFRVRTYPTAERGGLVLVWTQHPSDTPTDALPQLAGSAPGLPGRASLAVPQQAVVEALLRDPIAALDLGEGSGRTLCCETRPGGGSIAVRRQLTSLSAGLRALLGAKGDGPCLTRTETWAVSGLSELCVEDAAGGTLGRLLVAPVSRGPSTSEILWRVTRGDAAHGLRRLVASVRVRLARRPQIRTRGSDAGTEVLEAWRRLSPGADATGEQA